MPPKKLLPFASVQILSNQREDLDKALLLWTGCKQPFHIAITNFRNLPASQITVGALILLNHFYGNRWTHETKDAQ